LLKNQINPFHTNRKKADGDGSTSNFSRLKV
jgi:hypothetical protein